MISRPMHLIFFHGIKYSKSRKNIPNHLHGCGTINARIHPVFSSISRSQTLPEKQQSATLHHIFFLQFTKTHSASSQNRSFYYLMQLHVETEYNNISVFYHILFSFQTHQPFFFCCYHAATRHQILICDHFRADKSTLKVRMDLSCRLWSLCSFFDRPCSGLIFSCCKDS